VTTGQNLRINQRTFRLTGSDRVAAAAHNPFVPITPEFKLGVLIYFVVWRFFPELAQPFFSSSGSFGLEASRSAIAVCVQILILWPIMSNRFGGTPTGWLHPLILSSMIGIATELIKNPLALLDPVSTLGERTIQAHALLSGDALLVAQIETEFWTLLGLGITYAAFSQFQYRVKSKPLRTKTVPNGTKFAGIYLCFFAAALLLITGSGGVSSHMEALAFGRYRAISDEGILLVPITFLPSLCSLWYLYRPETIRNPLFLVAFGIAVLLQFVALGSRSGLFSSAIVLLLAWMFVHCRVPAVRLFVIGLSAILLLGFLGQVRSSGLSGDVDWGDLSGLQVEQAIQENQTEIALRRFRSGPEAIAARVPERVAYRYGETYIGGLLFFVPRSVWEEKPRGPGPTVMALLFEGRSTVQGYQGGGQPAGGAGEAYFNFGYPGMIIIFMLFGLFLKAMTALAIARPTPLVITFLIILGLDFSTPSTTAIVPFLQKTVLLLIVDRLLRRRIA
jgi:hypothetical protein